MIPQVINYIWVGDKELPKIFKVCKESWEKHCPNYKFILWTENDIEFDEIPFLKHTYENRKFSKFSNYYRMWILYHYGGVYLDIDVELINSLESLMDFDAFFSTDKSGLINSGSCFGAKQGLDLLSSIMKEHETSFLKSKDTIETCPILESRVFNNLNLFDNANQARLRIKVLTSEYFDPYDWEYGKGQITYNTIGIHHYSATWLFKGHRFRLLMLKKIRPILGIKLTSLIGKVTGVIVRIFETTKNKN